MDLDDEFGAPVSEAVVEDLEPLAAPADRQVRWVSEKHLPLEELWLQLDDDILGVPHPCQGWRDVPPPRQRPTLVRVLPSGLSISIVFSVGNDPSERSVEFMETLARVVEANQ
jgi:hypothetical protein